MSSPLTDDLQKQLITDLLIESFEGLDRFDEELLALEKGARDDETLNVIFRVIHTIKGTAGCIGLGRIDATAHVGESLLSLVRDGKIQTSGPLISALLSLSDALRAILRHIEVHGTEGDADHTVLLRTLQSLQNSGSGSNFVETSRTAPIATAISDAVESSEPFGLFGDTRPPLPSADSESATPPATPRGAVIVLSDQDVSLGRKVSVSDSAIRVEVAQLDKLMNLVGELVLARNQIIQNVTQPDPAALLAAPQSHHHRVAGQRHENADAAHRKCLGQISPHRARSRAGARQKDQFGDGRSGDRARSHHHRSDQRSSHPHREKCDRSRPRTARHASGRGQARGGASGAAHLPRGRTGQHRIHR